MGRFRIGARVMHPGGASGKIIDKRKGERCVKFDAVLDPAWYPKGYLTPIATNDNAAPSISSSVSEKAYTDAAPAENKWVPKVGDRVRFTDKCDQTWWFGPHTAHQEGVIVDKPPYYGYAFSVQCDDGLGGVNVEHIEPVVAGATTIAEAWTPKPGDRVNWTRVRGEFDGSIVEAYDGLYDFKLRATNGKRTYAFTHELEPAPLTIEAGRYYKTRDGRKVGPIIVAQGVGEPWPTKTADGELWFRDNGFSCPGSLHLHRDDDDLVAEWVEPAQPEVAVAEATATPLTIVSGGVYRSRGGEVWTNPQPIADAEGGRTWRLTDEIGREYSFYDNGRFFDSGEALCDLVEVISTPEPAPPPAKFRVGDRVVFNTKCPGYGARYTSGVLEVLSTAWCDDDGGWDVVLKYDDSDYSQIARESDVTLNPPFTPGAQVTFVGTGKVSAINDNGHIQVTFPDLLPGQNSFALPARYVAPAN